MDDIADYSRPTTGAATQFRGRFSCSTKKIKQKYWILSGIVLGILCLCSIVCIALVVSGANKIQSAQAPVLSVIDSYTKFMVEKDAKSAHALFSPRAHRIIQLSNLEKDLVGSNFAIFEGYQVRN